MISKDVIKQLVGEAKGWDQNDTLSFNIYGCSKFDGATCDVDFERGIVSVYNEKGDTVIKQYAILATLQEISK